MPDTSFYPDAYDRALTVQYLTRWGAGRNAIVNLGAVDILAISLFYEQSQFIQGTCLL